MPRKPCKFRQTDVVKAIKAAQATGLPIVRTEITSEGAIIVHHGAGAVEHGPVEDLRRLI